MHLEMLLGLLFSPHPAMYFLGMGVIFDTAERR